MTAATLTERYLHAVARRAPQGQSAELRREISERIGDDIDARIDAGTDPTQAEWLALEALGDPDRLLASYLERPQRLIGPRLYGPWKRLLKVLALTVLPTVGIAFSLAQTLAGASFGTIIGSTIVVLVNVVVHVGFWTTLVFAMLDRIPPDRPIIEWTPALLPEIAEPPVEQVRMDVLANFGFIVIAALGIFGHRVFLPFEDAAGQTISLFEAQTWGWLQWYLVGVLVLSTLFWMYLYRHRGWTYSLAAVNGGLTLAFAVPIVWALASDRLFNHDLLARTGWNEWPDLIAPGGALAVVFSFMVVIIAALWPIDAFLKARREARGAQGRGTQP